MGPGDDIDPASMLTKNDKIATFGAEPGSNAGSNVKSVGPMSNLERKRIR